MKRLIAVVLCLLLCVLAAVPVQAEPWITSGGGPERTGLVKAPVGFLEESRRIELPTGQSASQPLLIGDRVYHLAGPGLWEYQLTLDGGEWKTTLLKLITSNLDPGTQQTVRVSSSTPTYSPDSRWLYWGTAYGQLWGYDTVAGQAQPVKLDTGCSVVSSPLVLRPYGEDIVIVGQKPAGNCHEPGKIFAVWGWGKPGGPWKTDIVTGGWATPSPVPDLTNPTRFIAGADGVGCETGNGLAAKFWVERQIDGAYNLRLAEWGGKDRCVPNGVAGSFAVAEGYAFWVDTTGRLTARRLSDGKALPGWTDDHIDLPTALGGPGARAFTNTKPAIAAAISEDGKLTGTAFVTLRNYTGPGGLNRPDRLRGCPDGSRWEDDPIYRCPGAPGVLVAVDLATGTVKPYHQPTGAQFDAWLAANTDPLIVTAPNAVLFGDANGTIWGRPLAPGAGDTAAALRDGFRPELSLLHGGEEPMRGSETWSQISGAGVDPAVATGPDGTTWLLMGVNLMPPQNEEATAWQNGRLTLIPFGETFNLKWTGSLSAAPQTPWAVGAPVSIAGTVTLVGTTKPLGQLRPEPPGARVTWYIVPDGWDGTSTAQVVRLGPSPNLPATLRPGETVPVQVTVTPTAAYPKKGRLIGVIDAETLALDPTRAQGRTAAVLLKDPSTWPMPKVAELAGVGLTDNFTSLPFELANVDLAVIALHVPAEISCQDDEARTTATWVVANRSTQTLRDIPVVLRADGERIWSDRLAELAPGKTRTLAVPVSLSCDPTHLIEAEVNPAEAGRAIDEAGQYANISREQTVSVRDAVGAGGDGRSVLGNP